MVQFYVPMDFMEPVLHKCLRLDKLKGYFPTHHNTVKMAVENVFRAVVVMITGMCLSVPLLPPTPPPPTHTHTPCPHPTCAVHSSQTLVGVVMIGIEI